MNKLTAIVPVVAIVVAGAALYARRGESQPAGPDKLTIGIYAPSVEFGTAQVRLQYAQSLAKAIEAQTGAKTEAKSFAQFAQLKGSGVDFAIVDGQCYATSLGWPLLASAQVGGGVTRSWALYADGAKDMQALKGKKLAYVQTGCNDNGFIDNAMLDSEVDPAFFAGRVGKPDITAAVAEVASYKGAAAVFAPVGSQKGLSKVFDTGAVPNPGFVQLNSKLPSALVDKVAAAVVGFGGGGAISGWTGPNKGNYQGLAGAMGKAVKRGVFANPDPVRFEAKDVLIEPASLDDTAATGVRQHFERPPERME
ncbi:MAG: hypothetical protein IPL61_32895 [Myxococcales bacterium]|nr:hypothetical protein [Myxococcales bacterium]